MKNISFITLCCAAVLFVGCKDSNKQQGGMETDSPSEVVNPDTVVIEENNDLPDRIKKVSAKQEELVKEFYREYVFDSKPVKTDILSHYCTERLIKKLQDDYEYEGGGYAIWDFRTGNQDGPSKESRITSIKVISPVILEVHFLDMGTEGSHKIHFRPYGSTYLMDEIE